MKKLLNTFFFGYLELKWRRLVRALLLAYIIPSIILGLYWNFTTGINNSEEELPFIVTLILIVLAPLFSYILKPFVVKED